MLFFVDESWQRIEGSEKKVGVLAADHIKAHDFNECSRYMHQLKMKNLGLQAGWQY
jgi:hypothetical protein